MSQKIRRYLRSLRHSEEDMSSPASGNGPLAVISTPSLYRLGMSNLGFLAAREALLLSSSFCCERAFLPEPSWQKEHQRSQTPLLTIESQRAVREAYLWAISVSFEGDFPHLLTLLRLADVPLRAAERTGYHPLLLLGGAALQLNPEPIAPLADLIFCGEAEAGLDVLLQKLAHNDFRSQRPELAALEEFTGVYVPSVGLEQGPEGLRRQKTVTRAFPRQLSGPPPASRLTSSQREFASMELVEVSRGCLWGCRFCAAAQIYRPYREHNYGDLQQTTLQLLQRSETIGLIGSDLSDFTGLAELCTAIVQAGGCFSPSSLRINAVTSSLVEGMARAGRTTLTLAPEAGSERLRRVVNKDWSRRQILEAVALAQEAGIPGLRLYFLCGLPTETDEDIAALVALAADCRQQMDQACSAGKRGLLTLSLNPFIPKPHTPFQWEPLESLSTLRRRFKQIQGQIRLLSGVKLVVESLRHASWQALLARGDRSLFGLLECLQRHEGNRPAALRQWAQESPSLPVTPQRGKTQPTNGPRNRGDPLAQVYRPLPLEGPLPWDFLQVGAGKDYLLRERRRALEARLTPPCDLERCTACQVCSTEPKETKKT